MRRKTDHVHSSLVAGALAVAMLMPVVSSGAEAQSTNEPALKASESNPGARPTTYEGPGPQPKVGASEETAMGETWGDRSYVIPFFEVVAFEAALNWHDRTYLDKAMERPRRRSWPSASSWATGRWWT